MSRFFIAQITIDDPEEYQKYLAKAGEVFKQFNGRYLAVDSAPVLLEGSWDATKVVLIHFNTEEDFNAWYHSAAYQDILKHRLKAARCNSILANGLE